MSSRKVSLTVNNAPVELDYFVQSFIDHVVSGMLEALEGTEPIKKLDLSIKDNAVEINLNDAIVPANIFVARIVRNTVAGMVSSLKGVTATNQINIIISK